MTDLSFLTKEKLHTGFGETIVNPSSYEDILVQAGLNWTVDTHPAFTEIEGTRIAVPNTNIVVRKEDQKPLGVVSNQYKIVNNSDAFAFTESIFNSNEIEFIRGGSYRGGSATWLEAKITTDFSVLGDKTECYLIFMNSHDGSGSIRCMILPIRIACSNALNMPLQDNSRVWRCIHSGDPMRKLEEAREVLLAGSNYMKALQKECEALSKIKLSSTQVEQFTNRIFTLNDDMSDRQKDNVILRRDQLISVFNHKDDLQDFGSTGYKYVAAVADFVDHVEGRNTKNAGINRYMHVANGSSVLDLAYKMVKAA